MTKLFVVGEKDSARRIRMGNTFKLGKKVDSGATQILKEGIGIETKRDSEMRLI